MNPWELTAGLVRQSRKSISNIGSSQIIAHPWRCDHFFVPEGRCEISPPFQRWETWCGFRSPGGTTDWEQVSHVSAVPPGLASCSIALPPLKRWAKFKCPSGTSTAQESVMNRNYELAKGVRGSVFRGRQWSYRDRHRASGNS